MIRKLFVLLCLLAGTGSATAAPGNSSKLLLESLLTDSNSTFVLTGAKIVESDPATEQHTLDVIAELLSNRTDTHVATRVDMDLAAWFMKALGASESERYRPVIERAISVYANEKISTFGKLSLAKLTKPSQSTYSAGSISMEKFREELQAQRSALGRGTSSISEIKPRASLDSVFTALGYPDELVQSVDFNGRSSIFATIRNSKTAPELAANAAQLGVRSLQLRYYGRGLIDVDSKPGNASVWIVSAVWPDVQNNGAPYSGANPGDAALIMTSDPDLLLKLSRRLVSAHNRDTELLDRVAARVRVSMKSEEPVEVNALMYFCRLLGESGNKKYIEALDQIADQAAERGVRNFAKAALESLQAL